MRPAEDERLQHMLDAAREAVAILAQRSVTEIEIDRLRTLALDRSLEIIGEAASHVPITRQETIALRWSDITGMRHRIDHAYYDIDPAVVVQTVRSDLPPLIAALESVLTRRT